MPLVPVAYRITYCIEAKRFGVHKGFRLLVDAHKVNSSSGIASDSFELLFCGALKGFFLSYPICAFGLLMN
jgi:hypothetical protein